MRVFFIQHRMIACDMKLNRRSGNINIYKN